MPDVEKTSVFGTAVHAVLRAGDASTPSTLCGAARRSAASRSTAVEPVEPSLEDVFLDVVAEARP